MALRNIVKKGDAILSKKSRKVDKFDDRLHTLIDDMIETMHEADGVGLAAVQVGVLRRVVIVQTDETVHELVNPEIIYASEEQQCGYEGCLSFPGESAVVRRPETVTVRAQNRFGEIVEITGSELKARAFAHELDHLDGVVFQDVALSYEDQQEWEKEIQEEAELEAANS